MKKDRDRDATVAMKQYEAEKRAVLAKTARLRALRLANEAGQEPATPAKPAKAAKKGADMHAPSMATMTISCIHRPFPFVVVHLACFAAIWTGITWQAVVLCIALYGCACSRLVAGYHRYFSHRAYSTSRVFQFILAFVAPDERAEERAVVGGEAPAPPSALRHRSTTCIRRDTRASCTATSAGSSHRRHDGVDFVKVADLARYPELVWLHRLEVVPGDRARRAVLC